MMMEAVWLMGWLMSLSMFVYIFGHVIDDVIFKLVGIHLVEDDIEAVMVGSIALGMIVWMCMMLDM